MGVVVLALVSGCMRTESGQPSPSTGTAPSSAATTSTSDTAAPLAPPVTDPRDARGVAACAALQPAQVQGLGLDPGRQRELSLPRPFDKGCAWTSTDSAWSVAFGFDTATEGLSTLYKARDNYGHFQPRTIDGRPAVDAQTVLSAEDCYTYVGVADTQTLYINVDNSPALSATPLTPACDRVDEIVKMVIGNLPPLK